MKAIPPSGTPRDACKIYLPGGVPVLRTAVEELLKSGWDEVFRRRALEISSAFEGSFRASRQEELAALAHTVSLLLEIEAREVVMLGKHLESKLHELLDRMESRLDAGGEVQTG